MNSTIRYRPLSSLHEPRVLRMAVRIEAAFCVGVTAMCNVSLADVDLVVRVLMPVLFMESTAWRLG